MGAVGAVGAGGPGGMAEPHLVGGYHWDCSDWCGGGGALPGISEVAGSERPDSSSPTSPGSRASPAASPAPRRRRARLAPPDSDSALDEADALRLTDGECERRARSRPSVPSPLTGAFFAMLQPLLTCCTPTSSDCAPPMTRSSSARARCASRTRPVSSRC